ncbi:CaiB/BaiF CoA transferase family protein [Bordetella bronchiseptica]|uniref:CaiB/BaiF CoA transferase family protein n=1 Tax=Bordetella bronchiseptica TaxID=518 RepID=UPI00049FB4B6|nr:CaiB/BaiF CoA-transferase family protein [Bordetella bronchiseptica]KDC79580.1 CoA-transferase family III protein [Bordetella bronchiseptica MBORD632]
MTKDTTTPARSGPLAGLRILELGTMIAGPVVGTLLADFGAEVIKIEQPGTGDTLRQIGPFEQGESLYWNVEGRNKKSVTLDLRLPEGQALLRDLARQADAVVENFRPGTLTKWGLDYAELARANPRIVMLSISGFGQTGPNASRAAYDRIALAFGGLMHLTGYPDRPPLKSGNSLADYQSALFGAFALMMALYQRDACGGPGQHIDLALYESVFRFTDVLSAAHDRLGTVRQRQGNVHFAAAPGETFEMRDGRFLILTVSNSAMFARLCAAMDQPALAAEPRYATHELRWQHIGELNGTVAAWIKDNDPEHVFAALQAQGIAHATTYSIADIFADPHYAARQNIVTVDTPRLGPLKMQGVGPKFSATPAGPIAPAPALGEHTAEVLGGLLGLSEASIAGLAARGAI